MVLQWKETRNFVVKYLLWYIVVCLIFVAGMKWYKKRNYSQSKLETMISTVSKSRDLTDDPCKYAIFGEPTTAQQQYIKIYIFCTKSSKSLNSMDLRAIKDKTVGGALAELGRINGFKVSLKEGKIILGDNKDLKNDSWVCLQNRKKVFNFGEELIQKGTIDCFNGLTDAGIINFYETF
jgi:hypothetical protein